MKNPLLKVILAALVAVILTIPLAASVSAASLETQKTSDSTVAATQSVSLTADEEYWLTYMREEEKLARDVYLYLYDTWNLKTFNNISRSEQRHTNSVNTLLDRYGIPDPAANKEKGEFSNPELQALYDELINKGSVSLMDALKVGVLIENTDIADLNKAISSTGHSDISNVYTNLKNGSLNHLQAFNSNLARQ